MRDVRVDGVGVGVRLTYIRTAHSDPQPKYRVTGNSYGTPMLRTSCSEHDRSIEYLLLLPAAAAASYCCFTKVYLL